MGRLIYAADLFCGAGGTSTGLLHACESLGLRLKLLAINHWNLAIETHSANHPYAEHLCESMDSVDPRKAVPGGRLQILIASPECTHHSNARGGRPINDQSRASAWHILRWAEALRIDNILVENVREFQSWGPIGTNGRPLKSRRGETYRAFLQALRSLGYEVQDRILNAADFGDPTTRERLFILARRGRAPISWPVPTHTAIAGKTLFGKTQAWRAAREIIDWSIPGQSIFTRKRPLAPATLARMAVGLQKFGGEAAVGGQGNPKSAVCLEFSHGLQRQGNSLRDFPTRVAGPVHQGRQPSWRYRPRPLLRERHNRHGRPGPRTYRHRSGSDLSGTRSRAHRRQPVQERRQFGVRGEVMTNVS